MCWVLWFLVFAILGYWESSYWTEPNCINVGPAGFLNYKGKIFFLGWRKLFIWFIKFYAFPTIWYINFLKWFTQPFNVMLFWAITHFWVLFIYFLGFLSLSYTESFIHLVWQNHALELQVYLLDMKFHWLLSVRKLEHKWKQWTL